MILIHESLQREAKKKNKTKQKLFLRINVKAPIAKNKETICAL